ncbi:MAG: hypothetical protein JWO89_2442 [Verrucomicrobiaceae bacterium]|jgi:hypothetical protein|nr:hypothetical protein [Verrucomicrobiaceae bacterium]MDB6120830.1 hypothetical protein [Verrucomicrobiaceae bacterium]
MSTEPEAELDLAIANMDSASTETQARGILSNLPGVLSAHLHEMGALIKYRPGRITKETICDHLRKAGLEPTIFQDSASGTTGTVGY